MRRAGGTRWAAPGATPTYLYTGPDALDPMDRSPILGVRCAKYDAPPAQRLSRTHQVVRDLSAVRPADDATFAIYRSLFDYDPGSARLKAEAVDDRAEHWRAEKVASPPPTAASASRPGSTYPKNAVPSLSGGDLLPAGERARFPLPSSARGRATSPTWCGAAGPCCSRCTSRPTSGAGSARLARTPSKEIVTERTLDVRRALDYLESRPEIDHDKIAFYGLSMGAEEGTIVGAVEPRLRTLVLVAAGLSDDVAPEVDGVHFAPASGSPCSGERQVRLLLHVPVRLEPGPPLRLLGSPLRQAPRHVRQRPRPPWPDVVRETLNWLDRYLGVVEVKREG